MAEEASTVTDCDSEFSISSLSTALELTAILDQKQAKSKRSAKLAWTQILKG